MGARPSSFRKSGGFLNNVDGKITDYEFTDAFNGVEFVPGKDPKTKKERFHSLYCVLSVRVDGADEDITTTLFAGSADDFEITDNGHTLAQLTEDGDRELGGGTSFAKVISSLCSPESGDGFPEERLPEKAINYEPIIGTRCRFVQKTNVEDTKRLGKRKDKKTGKEYDRQDLLIEAVYELPSVEVAAPETVGKKLAKTVKGNKAAVEAPVVVDVKDLAGSTLVAILADNDNTIDKKKLSMKILTKLMKHDQREDVRKFLLNDDSLKELAEEGVTVGDSFFGVKYDKAKGVISLLAE